MPQVAAENVLKELRGREVNLEEQEGERQCGCGLVVTQELLQVDVVLFTCVEDIAAFMRLHRGVCWACNKVLAVYRNRSKLRQQRRSSKL